MNKLTAALGSLTLLASACGMGDPALESSFSCEEGVTSQNPHDYTFSVKITEGVQVDLAGSRDAVNGKNVRFVADGYQKTAKAPLSLSGIGSEKSGTIYLDDQALIYGSVESLASGIGLELKHDYWNFLRHHTESLGTCTIQVDPAKAIAAYNAGATLEYLPVGQTPTGEFQQSVTELGCDMMQHAQFSIDVSYYHQAAAEIGPSAGCSSLSSAEVYDYWFEVANASLDPDFLYGKGITDDYTPNTSIQLTYTGQDSYTGEDAEMVIDSYGSSPGADPNYGMKVGDTLGGGRGMPMQIDHLLAGDLGIRIYEERNGQTFVYADCTLAYDNPAELERQILASVNGGEHFAVFPNGRTQEGGLDCDVVEGFDRGNDGTGGILIRFGARLKAQYSQADKLDPSLL